LIEYSLSTQLLKFKETSQFPARRKISASLTRLLVTVQPQDASDVTSGKSAGNVIGDAVIGLVVVTLILALF
jgi:hypothetical protein